MTLKLLDAQAALSFLLQQATYIETEVDEIEYPEVQYQDLIPLDFSAPAWTKTVTYFSTDRVGKAKWFHAQARDVPRVDLERNRFETSVEMAAIGYGYDIEEITQAQQLGQNLTADKADAARLAYEEFLDDTLLRGDTEKGWSGFLAYPTITAATVLADGNQNNGNNATGWAYKTPFQIIRDFNSGLQGIFLDTQTVEMADTVLLPIGSWMFLSSTPLNNTSETTILDFLMKKNVYTMQTGQPLMVRAVRGLEIAGVNASARMITYKRNPRVLKAHIPMRHQFLEPMRTGPLIYEVPGIFRLGGLDVKRPGAIRYLDGI